MNNQNNGLVKLGKLTGKIWADQAKYRVKNRKWLGYSGKIALRIMSAMEDVPNMNQKKLAELAEVSPQQISKIMKGQENLTLKTIAKFSDISGTELISFPSFKYNYSFNILYDIASNRTAIMMTINKNSFEYINYEPMEFSINSSSFELNTVKLNLPQ